MPVHAPAASPRACLRCCCCL